MDNSVSSSIALPLRKAEVSHGLAFALMSGLFFMIGFLTSLNTILVPHLKSVFDLSYMVATLVQFAFFLAYFSLSLPIGLLIGWAGYKRTLMIGLLLCSLGCVLFLPAASYLSYPLFLGGLFILASGVTTLEVAGNPYVAVLGRWKNASSRLNLVHVFDSLGTVIGPIFAATFFFVIAGEGADPVARADAVKGPYLFLAITLIVLAVALAAARLPRLSDGHTEDAHAPAGQAQTSTAGSGEVAPGGSLWRYPHLVLGTLSIFIYVGCEVSVGSFLVSFLVQPNIGNMSAATAAHFVAFYWGGAMIGRLVGAFVLRRVNPGIMLGLQAIAATLLLATAVTSSGAPAMWAALAVGLCNSIMYPTIFALAVGSLGSLAGRGSGLVHTGVVGGAIVPVAQGILADHVGVQMSFILPAVLYVFIVYYGFLGSRLKHRA